MRQLDLCLRQSPPRAPSRRASTTCSYGYHLCNLRDLYAGGYMVARTMGWATSSSHVWSAEEVRPFTRAHTSGVPIPDPNPESVFRSASVAHCDPCVQAASGGDKKSSWGGPAPGTVDSGLGLCCQDSE